MKENARFLKNVFLKLLFHHIDVAVLKIVKKANKVLELDPLIQAAAILLRQDFYVSTRLSSILTRVDLLICEMRNDEKEVKRENFTWFEILFYKRFF